MPLADYGFLLSHPNQDREEERQQEEQRERQEEWVAFQERENERYMQEMQEREYFERNRLEHATWEAEREEREKEWESLRKIHKEMLKEVSEQKVVVTRWELMEIL